MAEELVGLRVRHVVLGPGRVTGADGRFVTVRFADGERRFVYPDAFSAYLRFENAAPAVREGVEKRLAARRAEHESLAQARRRRVQQARLLGSLPRSNTAQVAFGCVYNDPARVLAGGALGTGPALSGARRGRPRLLPQLYPNSALVLTHLPDGAPEEQRLVLGAAMPAPDLVGAECEDGVVRLHPRYRLQAPAGSRPAFWSYFAPEERRARWGRVETLQFANGTAAALLADLAALQPAASAPLAEEFVRYHAQLNGL